MKEKILPHVTVMIPVRNEAAFIEQTLKQIVEQDYRPDRLEIMVADGMSTDDTAEIVNCFSKSHPEVNLELLENEQQISSAGRNAIIRKGKGKYFLLIDGHVYIPSKKLITDAIAISMEKGARVLGRPQPLNPPGVTEFQDAIALARTSFLAHSGESYIYKDYEGWVSPMSVAVMYERSVFSEVGEFDESFDAAEDLEFNYRVERAGIQCFTSPKLKIFYYPRDSIKALFDQLQRYGSGRARFVCKHPERFTIETAVPTMFLIGLISLGVFSIINEFVRYSFYFVVAIYGGVLVGENIRLNWRNKKRYYFKIPAVIACIHMGIGIGFLKGFIGMLIQKKQGQGD